MSDDEEGPDLSVPSKSSVLVVAGRWQQLGLVPLLSGVESPRLQLPVGYGGFACGCAEPEPGEQKDERQHQTADAVGDEYGDAVDMPD